jgi:hypothetical protein
MKIVELMGDLVVGWGIFLAGLGAVMTLEYSTLGTCQANPHVCAYGEMANYVVWGLILTAFGSIVVWGSKRVPRLDTKK